MSEEKEVIAYAITHAGRTPEGKPIKGGPYEEIGGDIGDGCRSLRDAIRWNVSGPERGEIDTFLEDVQKEHPHARVIRIVRKARPSEASAVEVLRSFIAWVDCNDGEEEAPLRPIEEAARRVLAASGPDPSGVARAAMRFAEHCTPALEGSAWFGATCEFIDAVDAYRKSGGTP